jgi:hypothetical protein
VDVDAGRLDDLIVVPAEVVAVTLQDVELVPDRVNVGGDGMRFAIGAVGRLLGSYDSSYA